MLLTPHVWHARPAVFISVEPTSSLNHRIALTAAKSGIRQEHRAAPRIGSPLILSAKAAAPVSRSGLTPSSGGPAWVRLGQPRLLVCYSAVGLDAGGEEDLKSSGHSAAGAIAVPVLDRARAHFGRPSLQSGKGARSNLFG